MTYQRDTQPSEIEKEFNQLFIQEGVEISETLTSSQLLKG